MTKKISQITVSETTAISSDDQFEGEQADGTSFKATGTAMAQGVANLQNIVQGTYTPTLFNTTNVAASTASVCTYMRVGNVVIVFGTVSIDPTAAAATTLGMSLPIASNIGTLGDVGGVAMCGGVAGQALAIQGDSVNDRASFTGVVTDLANRAYAFIFSYRII